MATTITVSGQATDWAAGTGTVALLSAGAAMDLGRRTTQEDALGIFLPVEEEHAKRGSLFVLADGLGGHNAGEVASRLAVQAVRTGYYASPLRQAGNLLQAAVDGANRRVFAAGQDPALRGMGSTVVCAAVQGDTLWLANVGDSRAYQLRGGSGLHQLSTDHSLAAQQVRQGLIGAEDITGHGLRSVLLQSLGMASGVEPAFVGPVKLQKGDLLLLCTDGVYTALDDRAIGDYLQAALMSTLSVNPDQLAHDLVEAARFRGADDNMSAVLIYVHDVVPEAVARAAGWPGGQARTLVLPQTAPPPATAPAAADPHPAGSHPGVSEVTDRGLAYGVQPPTDSAREPGVRVEARMAPVTTGALLVGLAMLVFLAAAWVMAAITRPEWMVPILATMMVVAVPMAALLFVSRPRRVSQPASAPGPVAGPAPPPGPVVAPPAFGLTHPAAPTGIPLGHYSASDLPFGDPPDRSIFSAATDPISSLIDNLLPSNGVPAAADRGPGSPAGPPGVDYVSEAMSDSMGRARQQWTFNLLMAAVSASLVIGGCLLTVVTLMMGQGGLLGALFGPGVGLLGIVGWLVTQPAAQLNRADNQISLLTMVWANYSQELRSCGNLTDPTAAAACVQRAGGEAVQYFNQISGKPEVIPPATH